MPKLLAIADSPAMTTGFGTVARNVLKVFHDMGYEIHLLARNWDGHCPDHDLFPYRFYTPTPRALGARLGYQPDLYGYAVAGQLLPIIQPDLVFILASISDVTGFYVQNPSLKSYKTMAFATFESEAFPRWWLGSASYLDQLVVFSEWQARTLRQHPVVEDDRLAVIPHGHEPAHIKPLWTTLDERDNLRRSVGLPPTECLFFRCDRNEFRKQHGVLLKAYNDFQIWHPGNNAHLYLHMSYDDVSGWDMDDAIDVWCRDVRNGDGIIVTKDYDNPWAGATRTDLNLLYNIADYYVSTTGGEAWGLCLHESQAAGIPVIAPDNSACTEVVNGGYLVENTFTVDNLNCVEYRPPTPEAFAESMSFAYEDAIGDRVSWWEDRQAAMEWAEKMTWENVLRPLPNLIDQVMAREKRQVEEELVPVA